MRAWPAMVLALLLSACAGGGPLPEDRFYRVEVAAPAAAAAPLLRGGLLVERLRADALHAGRAVLYRQADRPLELGRHHYRFWTEAPNQMVQQQLAAWLRGSGLADHVYTGEEAMPHRYRLSGRVLAFEREIGPAGVTLHVGLQLTLTRQGDREPLLEKRYQVDQAVAGRDMHATALAAQQALETVFHSLAGDIARLDLVADRQETTL